MLLEEGKLAPRGSEQKPQKMTGATLTKIQPSSSKKSIVPFGRHEFKHDAYIASVSFSPDSKYIAAGGYDHKVIVYDIASKAMIQEYKHDAYENVTANIRIERFRSLGRLCADLLIDLKENNPIFKDYLQRYML